MTTIYFVRHAQPNFRWAEDLTRPLTAEGTADSRRVVEVMHGIRLDYVISSPYMRSVKTIEEAAVDHGLAVNTDARFRERGKGSNGNNHEMFRRRWADMDYHEPGGESLNSVQARNMEALFEVLDGHEGESIMIGTHGTALSCIMNYYDREFGCDDFLRIIDFMPYIVKMEFEGHELVSKEELLIIEKEFKPNGH